jgi:beta-galactosidase
LGIDWGDMLPVDSLKLHNKLAFIECDIRTNFTKKMQDSRPDRYPDEFYPLYDDCGNKTVWCGPETTELSVAAIRKAFAHQLVKSCGIWWFDMWGGWYHDNVIMEELSKLKKLYEGEKAENAGSSVAEVAFFVDENAYRNLPRGHFGVHRVNEMRSAMGNTGIPYDIYMVEDAVKVAKKYKVAIFTAFEPSYKGLEAVEFCKNSGIEVISAQAREKHFTVDELRETLMLKGVHCYNSDGAVVYISKGFFALHTVKNGETKIVFPNKTKFKRIDSEEIFESREIVLNLPKNSTEMFLLL